MAQSRVYLVHLLHHAKTIHEGGLIYWPRGLMVGRTRLTFACIVLKDGTMRLVDPALTEEQRNAVLPARAPSSLIRKVIETIDPRKSTAVDGWAVMSYFE